MSVPDFDTTILTFPIGFKNKDGQWYDKVVVREFLGRDNLALTSPEAQTNGIRGITKLLHNVILRVEDSSQNLPPFKPSEEEIRNMYVADRDYVLVGLRKHSMGPTVKVKFRCTTCGSNVVSDLPLDELENNPRPKNPRYSITLPHGLRDNEGNRHPEVTMTQLTGLQMEQLTNTAKIDPAKASLQAIWLSIVEVSGLDDKNYNQVLNCKKEDFDAFATGMADNRAGLDMQPDIICGNCNAETSIPLAVGVLFRSA